MALYWTEDRANGGAHDAPSRGVWSDGVYVPSANAGSRQSLTSLVHDFMRTLLDLHAGAALDRP